MMKLIFGFYRINQRQNISSYREKFLPNITVEDIASGAIGLVANETIVLYEKLQEKSSKTLNLYTIMMFSSTFLELIKHYLILKFAINASRNVHRRMVRSIVHTVMAFFDKSFIGTILNRFSQDLSIIDDRLPMALDALLGVSTKNVSLIQTIILRF